MRFVDLRSFLTHLEQRGELARIRAAVDPDQEMTIIQHRVIASGGPALLFENVIGSPYRVVTNLLGTRRRTDLVFGGDPARLGERVHRLSQTLMPPSLKSIYKSRRDLLSFGAARMRRVKRGPVLETVADPPDLTRLPVLTCWPEDGGPFFTLPLVHTTDPENGTGNLGMYRLQRFDTKSTGMHWQIERGAGFHFHKATAMDRPLPVSVILGGPPALIAAAVAPMPEGIDERLLAAYMMNHPLDVILRPGTGHRVPARAEFVIEGTVTPGDLRWEGPFGDHFGHYSHAADYPVFRVRRILARRDAIYPATVVGKPVQEDYYLGEALQAMTLPLLRMIRPAVVDLWAYPETGFHALAVMSVRERYPKEALKHTLGMLGEGQVSLTKVMITVDHRVDVKDFTAVSRALWQRLDASCGIHLLAPTAQDTLDFTGPAMNTGSRLILMAIDDGGPPLRGAPPPAPPAPSDLHSDAIETAAMGPAFLVVRTRAGLADIEPLRQALMRHPASLDYLFHVIVSDDVPLDNPMLTLWGWFTRFDPLADIYPAGRTVAGNRLIFDFPITIDARWKRGYPKPVEFDPQVEKKVDRMWNTLGLPNF
ncbi:menaquinone biosynthesis decarboxylase [Desulfosarcina ovata subsp. sediminis]|uniref:Menaquinone biosynthesis decarboxylase n=1 Tax=Desulfosarcina ovata subsp. sediminis TaxID=885957 RepID=A0A5K7ZE84_9BACT|nr:UbiD family decarboxylase [Desulfosarcina ovata]BBO79564.1 menaquinone biosynthesis decarboxylase [Desulfosarcina ovata subsp. sediminis]